MERCFRLRRTSLFPARTRPRFPQVLYTEGGKKREGAGRTLSGLPSGGRPARQFASVRGGAERSRRNIWVLSTVPYYWCFYKRFCFVASWRLVGPGHWPCTGCKETLCNHKLAASHRPLMHGLCHKGRGLTRICAQIW